MYYLNSEFGIFLIFKENCLVWMFFFKIFIWYILENLYRI